MKGKLLIWLALVAGFLGICGPAFAHHGSAAYADKMIVLKEATSRNSPGPIPTPFLCSTSKTTRVTSCIGRAKLAVLQPSV